MIYIIILTSIYMVLSIFLLVTLYKFIDYLLWKIELDEISKSKRVLIALLLTIPYFTFNFFMIFKTIPIEKVFMINLIETSNIIISYVLIIPLVTFLIMTLQSIGDKDDTNLIKLNIIKIVCVVLLTSGFIAYVNYSRYNTAEYENIINKLYINSVYDLENLDKELKKEFIGDNYYKLNPTSVKNLMNRHMKYTTPTTKIEYNNTYKIDNKTFIYFTLYVGDNIIKRLAIFEESSGKIVDFEEYDINPSIVY